MPFLKKQNPSQQDKQSRFEYHQKLKLKPIKESKIETVLAKHILDISSEGKGKDKVWIARLKDGKELRNQDKKALLRDVATINKYEVV